MKRSLPLLLLGGVLLVQPAAIAQESAEPTMLTHRVAEVTVYRDRALVTRRGGSLLARGVQEVVFEKLPNALDENSIRASGEGSARFKILGVEMRREYVKPAESGELATLQARQREINDRLNAIGGERENLDEQRQFLRQMRDKVLADTKKVSETSRVVSVGSLEELFAFYVQELAAIGERQRALQIEERTLNEEQTELRQKMALVQRPSSPDTRTAVVKVEVSQPGQAQFDLSYLIRGATWTPQYDAVARRPDQKVALTYYGVVRQTTGENWEDVKLVLSTARPNQNARLPELGTWTIGLPVPPSSPVTKSLRMKRDLQHDAFYARQQTARAGEANELEKAPMPALAEAEAATATISDGGPVATFAVAGTVTIPSDNQPHRTTVGQIDLAAEYAYEATPKLVPAAFLRASVTNGSAPLLPGRINVFQGGDYIGQSRLGLVAAEAKFDLYLGVDDGIKITREQKVPKEQMGGLLTSVKQYELGFTIKVENFKGQAEKVIIHDQLPVSRTGEVKVAVQEMAPGAKRNEDSGKLTWEFELGAKQSRELAVDYQVSCPPDTFVTGLPTG